MSRKYLLIIALVIFVWTTTMSLYLLFDEVVTTISPLWYVLILWAISIFILIKLRIACISYKMRIATKVMQKNDYNTLRIMLSSYDDADSNTLEKVEIQLLILRSIMYFFDNNYQSDFDHYISRLSHPRFVKSMYFWIAIEAIEKGLTIEASEAILKFHHSLNLPAFLWRTSVRYQKVINYCTVYLNNTMNKPIPEKFILSLNSRKLRGVLERINISK